MDPQPPPELEQYRYDRESARSPWSVRVLGWLAFTAFVGGIGATFLLPAEQQFRTCRIVYPVFIALFIAYVIARIATRHSRCSKCREPMTDIEVKWTPEKWQEIQGYEQLDSINGADGYLYVSDVRRESGAAPHCSIWAQLQVWCACHKCRLYFLKAKHSRRQIFAARDNAQFDKAVELLLSVPTAGDEIEAAYKKAWDEALGAD